MDLPDAAVYIYPDSGRQRIVEVQLSYHLSQAEMEKRCAALEDKVKEMAALLLPQTGDRQLLDTAEQILAQGGVLPEKGHTAYQALLAGGADSSGLALAMALLCQELDVPCQVVWGERDGEPHFWNVVQTETGYQHLDLTIGSMGEESFRSDQEQENMGYSWDSNQVPPCALREGRAPVEEET